MKKALLIAALTVTALFAHQTLAQEHIVEMTVANRQFVFTPDEIVIKSGDTVTWINGTDVPHNVVSETIPTGAKHFNSPFLTERNEKWSRTFSTTGDYSYYCLPHKQMGMTGWITVE